MIVFQFIAIPLCLLLFGRGIFRFFRGERHRWGALIGALLWAAAAVTIAQPDLTNYLAAALGIGRGTDLVVYLLAIASLVAFFYFYQKFRKLESDLTEVVRGLAIRDGMKRGPDDTDEG